MTQITCRGLAVGDETKLCCSGIDFAVNEGDYIAVIGNAGAGKSELLETLLGFRPALRGEVLCENGFRPSDAGYLPRLGAMETLMPGKVKEVVLAGRLRRTRSLFVTKKQREAARQSMEAVGIEDWADLRFSDLSGGQRQRVLLARALCSAGRMLVLDEPACGLDVGGRQHLYDLLWQLNRHCGVTVIVSTDESTALPPGVQKVLHLHQNRVASFKAVEDYRP